MKNTETSYDLFQLCRLTVPRDTALYVFMENSDSATSPWGLNASLVLYLLDVFPFPSRPFPLILPFSVIPHTQNVIWARGCGG